MNCKKGFCFICASDAKYVLISTIYSFPISMSTTKKIVKSSSIPEKLRLKFTAADQYSVDLVKNGTDCNNDTLFLTIKVRLLSCYVISSCKIFQNIMFLLSYRIEIHL